MGSHPYFYFTKYQEDTNLALQKLRQKEFEAGRYDPVMHMWDFEFPPTAASPTPGAQHSSIDEAMEDGGASGTGSILDINRTLEQPDLLASSLLPTELLLKLVGTDKPTHDLVNRIVCQEGIRDDDNLDEDEHDSVFDEIDRGCCFHFVVYENDAPSELFFMGYSID